MRGGIKTATRQQRKALEDEGVNVVESPWADRDSTGLPTSGVFRDYDVAHCNVIGPGTLAVARHARRNDIPLILHAHTTGEDFAESFRFSSHVAPILKRYLRWFYSQADLVLCPSQYTRDILRDYPVDAPIEPITNGVDIEALDGFEEFREETRERFELSDMVVFAVGSVFERKGVSTFCRVAEETQYDFAWFGHYHEGPVASEEVCGWTQNPPKNVTFTGWVDDKRMAYGAGDVYLFPTKNENQGITVLEAMACGKPVVIRDIPVFEQFFTDGVDCLKCETRDEFVAALDRLADDPGLRERLGENAQKTAAEHSLESVGEQLIEAYETAMEA